MEKGDLLYQQFLNILEEELRPAMGCTEPIALAYAGAKARQVLGCIPEQVEITVSEDGYVAEYNMEFDMEMTMSMAGLEVTVSAEVEAEIEIENPGEPVTVTPPEGYQDYPEVDADEVGI